MRIRKVESISANRSIDPDKILMVLCSIVLLIDGLKSAIGEELVDEENPENAIKKIPDEYKKICNEKIDKDRFKDSRYDKAVRHFLKTIAANVPDDDLSNLRENYRSLEIVDNKSFRLKRKYKHNNAIYEHRKNRVIIFDDSFNAIYHELLHMASFKKVGDIHHVGFAQYDEDTYDVIGVGLNEGYTVILSEWLFKDKEISDGYWYLKEIAEQVEDIVGEEQMMHFYFTADLYGLKEELCKYVSEEEVIDFLRELDQVFMYTPCYKEFIKNKGYAEFSISNIQNFLIKCNVRKKYLEYEQEDISKAKKLRKELNQYLVDFYDDYYFFDETIKSTSFAYAKLSVNDALFENSNNAIVRKNTENRN